MSRFLPKLTSNPTFCTSVSTLNLESLNFGKFESAWGCYSPSDIVEAQQLFKANCGPAAFSAVCRSPVLEVMRYFPHFPARDWTTLGNMKTALQTAGTTFVETGTDLPEYGLALLQLLVNDRPLHPLFSLGQTHWVGVWRGCFYDVNWKGWLTIPLWKQLVLPRIRFGSKRVIAWEVRNAIAVLEEELVEAAFGYGKTRAGYRQAFDYRERPAVCLEFGGMGTPFGTAA